MFCGHGSLRRLLLEEDGRGPARLGVGVSVGWGGEKDMHAMASLYRHGTGSCLCLLCGGLCGRSGAQKCWYRSISVVKAHTVGWQEL